MKGPITAARRKEATDKPFHKLLAPLLIAVSDDAWTKASLQRQS